MSSGALEQDDSPDSIRVDESDHSRITSPKLMRVSEVDRDCSLSSTPAKVVKWLREFIACPHPDLDDLDQCAHLCQLPLKLTAYGSQRSQLKI